MHIHNNPVLHYYNMAVGLVIYSKARAFKVKVRPRPRINIPIVCHLGLSKIQNQLLVGSERHWRHRANFRGDTLRGCVDTTFRPIEFKMAAIRHVRFLPEIVFLCQKLLGVLHISPKFYANISIRCWDTEFCWSQKCVSPPSWICCCVPVSVTTYKEDSFGGLYGWAKCGWNWQRNFGDMQLVILREFALKVPIYSRLWAVLQHFTGRVFTGDKYPRTFNT